MAIEIPPEVTEAKKTSQQLGQAAQSAISGEYTIGDVLKQKVNEAYNYSKDILNKFDTSVQEYFSAYPVAREKYADVFNPFSRERLVSQEVGLKALPMLSLADILGTRFGRIQDLIGTGVNAYKAWSANKQALWEQARQNYIDLLNEWQTKTQLEQRQYELEHPSGSGGGTSLESLLALIAAMQGNQTTGGGQPTEPMPETTPSGMPYFKSGGNIGEYATLEPIDEKYYGKKSLGGQWKWTENGWQPTGEVGETTEKRSLEDLFGEFL